MATQVLIPTDTSLKKTRSCSSILSLRTAGEKRFCYIPSSRRRMVFTAWLGASSTKDPMWLEKMIQRRWAEVLDREGIDRTVIYPTAALGVGYIQDPEWASSPAAPTTT